MSASAGRCQAPRRTLPCHFSPFLSKQTCRDVAHEVPSQPEPQPVKFPTQPRAPADVNGSFGTNSDVGGYNEDLPSKDLRLRYKSRPALIPGPSPSSPGRETEARSKNAHSAPRLIQGHDLSPATRLCGNLTEPWGHRALLPALPVDMGKRF